MTASRRPISRLLPEPVWFRAQAVRLRARHLPMRVLPEGRAALARLAALRDVHRRETCVILGNGPSIADLDLHQLDGVPTFCLNRGYLLWEDSGRTPSYFVAVNDLVIEQFHDEIAALPCPLFVPWIYREWFQDAPNATFVEVRNEQRFIGNATRGVAPCGTVTVAALQLAFHMGFSTVILLGVDHRFVLDGPPHALVRQKGSDQNHFRDDYFGDGTLWSLPDLKQSERGYEMSRKVFELGRREIVNATPGTALHHFRQVGLEQELRRSKPGFGRDVTADSGRAL